MRTPTAATDQGSAMKDDDDAGIATEGDATLAATPDRPSRWHLLGWGICAAFIAIGFWLQGLEHGWASAWYFAAFLAAMAANCELLGVVLYPRANLRSGLVVLAVVATNGYLFAHASQPGLEVLRAWMPTVVGAVVGATQFLVRERVAGK
jgi:hypothetical protein